MAQAELHHDTHSAITPATYLKVWVALLVLLVLTSAAARVNLPGPLNIGLAMAIAVTKAVLIFVFFMHLKIASLLVRIFAVAAFVWLIILFGLTFSDYYSRPWMDSTSMYLR